MKRVAAVVVAILLVSTLAYAGSYYGPIGTGSVGPQGPTGATGLGLQAPSIFTALGTPANGTIAYCTDCDPTATLLACTHVGAQTGAFAHRVNGAWKCIG